MRRSFQFARQRSGCSPHWLLLGLLLGATSCATAEGTTVDEPQTQDNAVGATSDEATGTNGPSEDSAASPTTVVAATDQSDSEDAPEATLVIEAWDSRGRTKWEKLILPAFPFNGPIEVLYQPTEAADYDGQLAERLDAGTAGDIITCRPFDRSLALFEAGHLLDLTELEGIDFESFDERTWEAWSTDDNASRFCVPISSVMHGFFYNTAIFDELGLSPPETIDEMIDVLTAIAEDGRYVPLALGTRDRWRPGEVGFTNIGPAFWGGDAGRRALIAGDITFRDPRFVALFDELERWRPFLPDASEFVAFDDARELFGRGEAAIYPGGSWEIVDLNGDASFKVGVFKPPRRSADEGCFVIDHPDLGLGVNAATPNRAAALDFVRWAATADFAAVYTAALPGSFPLNLSADPQVSDLEREFDSWRDECDKSIRLTARFLERGPGEPTEYTIWDASTGVLNGQLTSVQASELLDDTLSSWYAPTSG